MPEREMNEPDNEVRCLFVCFTLMSCQPNGDCKAGRVLNKYTIL